MDPHEEEPVALHDRPALDLRGRGDAFRVGDVDTAPAAVVAPVVEGAAQRVLHDRASDTEVCAQVGAVGIEDVGLPIGAPKGDEVAAEVVECLDRAGRQRRRLDQAEPARRKGQGNAKAHELASISAPV